jgi:hypothetical protein
MPDYHLSKGFIPNLNEGIVGVRPSIPDNETLYEIEDHPQSKVDAWAIHVGKGIEITTITDSELGVHALANVIKSVLQSKGNEVTEDTDVRTMTVQDRIFG